MSKLTRIDRNACVLLRDRLDAILKGALDDLGVVASAKNASFDPAAGLVTFKVEIGLLQGNGEVITREAAAFKQLASALGMKPTDLGREFTSRGAKFYVAGYKTRAGKMPILAKDASGRMFKFELETVRKALGYAAPTGPSMADVLVPTPSGFLK
jgi:hypothetical protein